MTRAARLRRFALQGVLNLTAGDIELATLPNRLDDAAYVFQPGVRYIIQLHGVITPAARAALQGTGVRLSDYMSTDCFLADLSATTPAALKATGLVAWAGEWPR